MLNTERLCIYPASREQTEAVIASEQDEDLKKAYTKMLRQFMMGDVYGTRINDIRNFIPDRSPAGKR